MYLVLSNRRPTEVRLRARTSIHTLHKGNHYGRVSTFAFELLVLSTIEVITSAAVISVCLLFLSPPFPLPTSLALRMQTSWPTLFKPAVAQQRHVLIALLAFAWAASTLALSLLATSAIFVLSKSALAHPLHARYDPHASC